VTREVADNFQVSLYFEKFDKQAVKKLPYSDQARERQGSSDVISDGTRRIHTKSRQEHPYYSSMKSQCTQVRGKSQHTT
jgi:hypothetical protein